MSYTCQSPILFIVFNRPAVTRRVFEEIRKSSPSRLYIAVDGPREGIEEDLQNIKACKSVVAHVDWDCEVMPLYRERNLGCAKAVSSAISWFFEQETEGIIIEDDCLPSKDFFRFCDEMLKFHRDNPRVMQISGFNLLKEVQTKESYYYSRVGSIWGWATWRRAWAHYEHELDLSCLDDQLEALNRVWMSNREMRIRRHQFTTASKINTWDYQWLFAKLIHSGLTVVPRSNLIENIGFGPSATHTKGNDDRRSIAAGTLDFPLKHPESAVADTRLDKLDFEKAYPRWIETKSFLKRVLGMITGESKNAGQDT